MPTPIPERVIESLRLREDAGGCVRLDYRPNFRTGDKIRILEGAFADCLGLYEGMRDSDRVAILLDLLGRKVRVTVDVEAVAAA
jgi:transcriptional antiterminator RfaH